MRHHPVPSPPRFTEIAAWLITVPLCACLPDPPTLPAYTPEVSTGDSAGANWPDLDPPGGSDGDGGHGGDPSSGGDAGGPAPSDAGASQTAGDLTDGDADTGGGTPTPSEPGELRLVRVDFDPEGTDGAPESPERVELVNLGTSEFPLDALRIDARSWPVVDAARLGLEGETLAPGARLRIDRWTSGSEGPTSDEGEDLHVGFAHGSGLRNVDGAIRLDDGLGGVADLLLWGPEPSPAPYDEPEAWSGTPAPGESGSLCRTDPWGPEFNDAGDWQDCESSPPLLDMLP